MRFALWVLALAAVAATPLASADDCSLGAGAYCDMIHDAGLNDVAGQYSDIVVAVVALIILVGLIAAIITLFRRGSTQPRIRAQARQETAEVGPGGSVQLLADVENARKGTSIDVVAEWDDLPPEWTGQAYAALAYPSGFTAPQVVALDSPLHLSSVGRGSHRATVAAQLNAPQAVAFDEAFEFHLYLVPVLGGVRKPRKAKKLTYNVHLSTRASAVEIADVVHDPVQLVAGKPVRTMAKVTNQGDADAQNVAVNLILNDEPLDRKVVAVVAARQEAAVEFNWTPRAGENRIRISLA